MIDNDLASVRRILVIKLRAIGDVLLSTIVLSSLRAAYPHAEIDFLTERPSRDVIEGNPAVNSVLVFDGKKEGGLSLIRRVRARRYDMVIDLFGNPRSAVVAMLSGAKFRIGYRFGWRKHCYNIVVEPRGGEVHNSEFNLDALRAIKVPVTDAKILFPVTEAAEKFADAYFREQGLTGKFVVAMNPGGGWYTKRWPPEQYAALGDLIQKEFGATVIITWGPGEKEVADSIAAKMSVKPLLIPNVGLKELASILKRCSVMVTNDSGPMHIAASIGTPIVAMYGPTRPALQGPVIEHRQIVQNLSVVCLGCNYTDCPIGNPCMQELGVEQVAAAFRTLVGELQKSNFASKNH